MRLARAASASTPPRLANRMSLSQCSMYFSLNLCLSTLTSASSQGPQMASARSAIRPGVELRDGPSPEPGT